MLNGRPHWIPPHLARPRPGPKTEPPARPRVIWRLTARRRHDRPMGHRRAAFPAVLSALPEVAGFALTMGAALHLIDHDSWQRAFTVGAITGALCSVTTFFTTRRERRAYAAELAGLNAQQRHEVERAAGTGAPPAQPTLRIRAATLVAQRLAAHERSGPSPSECSRCSRPWVSHWRSPTGPGTWQERQCSAPC